MNEQNVEKETSNRVATDLRQTVYVVGTDEAGYGPNLGPLVVGASCWRIRLDASDAERFGDQIEKKDEPATDVGARKKTRSAKKKTTRDERLPLFDFSLTDVGDEDSQVDKSQDFVDSLKRFDINLFRRANEAVERLNLALSKISDRRGIFPLVDSKKLYGASKSLAALERSFWLATLLANEAETASRREILANATFRSALQLIAREYVETNRPAWERDVDFPLPADSKTKKSDDDFFQTLSLIDEEFALRDVELIDLLARRVQPLEFNELVDALGLKSSLIAEVTTSLAVETLDRATRRIERDETPPIFIVLCDKLGGRDRYAPLLSERFPDAKIETVVESRAASVYRFAAARGVARDGNFIEFASEILVEIRFTAKGEANVPTALASITAKYFRELSMIPFNEFWRRETGDELRPTAGYPLDAKRFRAEVDDARRRLGIGDDVFWRKK